MLKQRFSKDSTISWLGVLGKDNILETFQNTAMPGNNCLIQPLQENSNMHLQSATACPRPLVPFFSKLRPCWVTVTGESESFSSHGLGACNKKEPLSGVTVCSPSPCWGLVSTFSSIEWQRTESCVWLTWCTEWRHGSSQLSVIKTFSKLSIDKQQ
jgi:hypothetical protein